MEKLADISTFENVAGRPFGPVPVTVFSNTDHSNITKTEPCDNGTSTEMNAILQRARDENI